MVIAALLNFQNGAGMLLLLGNGQTFEGRLSQRLHRTDLLARPHSLFQQLHDLRTPLGAKDQPCPRGQ